MRKTALKLGLAIAAMPLSLLLIRVTHNSFFFLPFLISFPFVILYWIDLGREIRSAPGLGRLGRALGILMGVPQALFGLLCAAIGLAMIVWVLYNTFVERQPEYTGGFLTLGIGPVLVLFGLGWLVSAFRGGPAFRSRRSQVVSNATIEPVVMSTSDKEERTVRSTSDEEWKQHFASLPTDTLIDVVIGFVEHRDIVLDTLRSRGIFNERLSELISQRAMERNTSAIQKMDEKIRRAQEIPLVIKEYIELVECDRASGSWWKAKKHIRSICKEVHGLLGEYDLKVNDASNRSPRMLYLFQYLLGVMEINENEASFFRRVNANFLLRLCILILVCIAMAFVLYSIDIWLILIPLGILVVLGIIDIVSTTFKYEGDSPFDKEREILADAALLNLKKLDAKRSSSPR